MVSHRCEFLRFIIFYIIRVCHEFIKNCVDFYTKICIIYTEIFGREYYPLRETSYRYDRCLQTEAFSKNQRSRRWRDCERVRLTDGFDGVAIRIMWAGKEHYDNNTVSFYNIIEYYYYYCWCCCNTRHGIYHDGGYKSTNAVCIHLSCAH